MKWIKVEDVEKWFYGISGNELTHPNEVGNLHSIDTEEIVNHLWFDYFPDGNDIYRREYNQALTDFQNAMEGKL